MLQNVIFKIKTAPSPKGTAPEETLANVLLG